ncbi:MAG: hypothetical protein OXG95_02505, partial [Chloroflexi bacterium]|nr:hypothetical protein [Chloroflexota bacterium]
MRNGVSRLLLVLLAALLALACDRAAELIPGSDETPTPTPTPAAANRTHTPIVAPAALRISGSAAANPSGPPAPSDADLARSV